MNNSYCLFYYLLFLILYSYSNIITASTDIDDEEFIIDTINIDNFSDPNAIDLQSLDLYDIKVGSKIIGGTLAKRYQFPYQAAVYIFGKSGRILFCGAALISKQYVLTAAHCIFEKPQRILVILGNERLMHYNKYEIRSDVVRYIIHKKFNREELRHDICLLQLNKTIKYSRAIAPIALPKLVDCDRNFLNTNALVSGFGKTQDGGDVSQRLMFVELPVMDNEMCNNWFDDREAVYTNICTDGMDGRGACQGDSGGPLIIDKALIGLVSFGARYCSMGYPSVYTRVPCYVKWIANYTKLPVY